jgi:pSer/pThr/pTyr-binding forkhead associated (FHA) protein
MAKLILRFGNATLKEIHVGQSGVRIGRSPDNAMVIDNQAVSHHHARVFTGTSGRLLLEDLGSMNGTFVNGQLARSVAVKPGDCITIGKHNILVEDSREMCGFLAWKAPEMPALPNLNQTQMLVTKDRASFLQRAVSKGQKAQVAPDKLRVPTLVVRKGKTDQKQYLLADKLTVIGKSSMATIKLRGWFGPKVAAHINRREDLTYFIGPAGRVPTINGRPITRPSKLLPGDVIRVAGVVMEFGYGDEAVAPATAVVAEQQQEAELPQAS